MRLGATAATTSKNAQFFLIFRFAEAWMIGPDRESMVAIVVYSLPSDVMRKLTVSHRGLGGVRVCLGASAVLTM
jgi:hypothetical protein